jgi:predicted AAA+ superfamily ATPase
VYRRGGDSLMGRYFLYRMHPFSVAECIDTTLPNKLTRQPCEIAEADWDALWQFGGFPEPFLKRKESFSRQWASLRLQQLSKEDIRETSQIQNLAQLGVLVQILAERSAEQLIYASLAQEVAVAPITVKGWISLLESLHYGFTVRPWHKKVANSLRKEPKWFLRDWSSIKDEGQKSETFVACHLLKACQGWTDLGLGSFDLHYLRTKQKKEVDFLVSKDGVPWSLFEVKHSERSLSKSLVDFQNQLKVPHAFQVVLDLPYEQVDCFSYDRAIVVPARTILSQLL